MSKTTTKDYSYKYRKWISLDGHRFLIRANTRSELQIKIEKKRREEEEKRKKTEEERYRPEMPFRKWAEKCIAAYKTTAGYEWTEAIRGRMKQHVYPAIGELPLQDVDGMQLQAILNNQQRQGKSWSHCNKLKQELRFVFRKAVELELINKDPTAGLVLPKVKKGTRRALTIDESSAFLAACNDDPRFVLFELMFFCGCRSAEAWNVKGSDLMLEKGHPVLHIRGTKTAAADRYVPIPEVLWDEIKDTPKDAFVATNSKGGMHTKSSYRRLTETLKQRMQEMLGDEPLAPDFTPYCLRHNYCTLLQRSGVDIRVAQRLMGHEDIQMTANIYTHTDMSEIIKAGRRLDGEPEEEEGSDILCKGGSLDVYIDDDGHSYAVYSRATGD